MAAGAAEAELAEPVAHGGPPGRVLRLAFGSANDELPKELAVAFGGEGVGMMADFGATGRQGPDDLDDVESRRVAQQAVGLQKGDRGMGHPAAAEGVDRLGGSDADFRPAGLYLDENNRLAVNGYDVNLAVA